MLYEYWFAGVKPLSDTKKKKLRKIFGSGKEIFYTEEKKLENTGILTKQDMETLKRAKKEKNLEESWHNMEKQKLRFVPCFAREYPEKLKEIHDFPYALYVKGSLPRPDERVAAIVGARRCTAYGEAMALEYGEKLAGAGVAVISGMARGIDGAGHRGALNAGGHTYAVLGCGTDICYPRENIGLYMDIQKKGGVFSEQRPGEPPLPFYFPQRNRIISGLADIILVMEAKEKSGSLITADLGLEQGKDIYALPGPVTSPSSQGCHRLIGQGAGILLSPEDLLKELDIHAAQMCLNDNKEKKVLETLENMVYSCLDLFPKGVEELAACTSIRPRELLQVLTTLEIEGLIKEVSKNYYIKVRK